MTIARPTSGEAAIGAGYTAHRSQNSYRRKIMEGRFLQGKVAVVTGASRGLGRAMALALGESGARLALVGRNRDKLAETRKLAADIGAESEMFVADVRCEFARLDRKSTRLNSSHQIISYAVF